MQNMQPDPNPGLQNPEQIDPVIVSIGRTQKAIYWMSGINILLILVFCEVICLYRGVCHTSADINIPIYASHGFLPVMIVTLLLTLVAYESAEFIHINYLGPLRILMLIVSILIISFSIAEFVAGMVLADTSKEDTWNQLTPIAQSYYDDDSDELSSDYRTNVALVCLFQLICGVILLACGITVWVLYSKTPTGYLPKPKYGARNGPTTIRKTADDNRPLDQGTQGRFVEERRSYANQSPPRRFDDDERNADEMENRGGYTGVPRMQEIREDEPEHPMAPPSRNPFLRQTK